MLCHEWAHALAWNFSLDRLAKSPGVDPAVFDRACYDEAWGCAYSRVWRAYLEADRADGSVFLGGILEGMGGGRVRRDVREGG